VHHRQAGQASARGESGQRTPAAAAAAAASSYTCSHASKTCCWAGNEGLQGCTEQPLLQLLLLQVVLWLLL
jgi:hypothetical protein